jgi:hypothetical protein
VRCRGRTPRGTNYYRMSRPYPTQHLLHFCNINSLPNKMSQLRSTLLFSNNTAFIAIAETHLHPEAKAPRVAKFTAHNYPYSDRSSGICAYTANTIASRPLPDATRNHRDRLMGSMAVGIQIKLFGALTWSGQRSAGSNPDPR